MDAAVSPGRILVSEADDGLSGFACGGSSAWPMRVGPVVRHETPVPGQDRVGLDQEGRPAVTVEHTRERREDCTVAGFETRNPRSRSPDEISAPTGQHVGRNVRSRLLVAKGSVLILA